MDNIANLFEEIRVVCRRRGSRRPESLTVEAFAATPLSELDSLRAPLAYSGSTSYQGRWWCSRTRRHVPFGSLKDRDAIMLLDHQGGFDELLPYAARLLSPAVSRRVV